MEYVACLVETPCTGDPDVRVHVWTRKPNQFEIKSLFEQIRDGKDEAHQPGLNDHLVIKDENGLMIFNQSIFE